MIICVASRECPPSAKKSSKTLDAEEVGPDRCDLLLQRVTRGDVLGLALRLDRGGIG
jgi:hypothetical protein